tara:strand:- start:890 stop:1132 length:243 start_codon:yes stop_codon:yes gene_type:complete
MKYTPNEYTGKSLMMGKKKMMYGGMNRQKKMYGSKAKMMGGGRAMYGAGGYASVGEMAKKCASMTVTESSQGRKLKDPSA